MPRYKKQCEKKIVVPYSRGTKTIPCRLYLRDDGTCPDHGKYTG